jgi:integral membrane protein
MGRQVGAALTRYRVIAYVVGVMLIVLVAIGVPLKYIWGDSRVVATVGTAHGYLYMIYLLASFDLGRRARWSLGRMAKVMLAGTVPFLSFYAERVVTRWIREQERRHRREPEPVAN